MKKAIIALALSIASASAFADPALVVDLDGGCSWFVGPNAAAGNIHFVLNDGDQWVLSCHGEMTTEPPEEAIVFKSTNDEPTGFCFAFGYETNNLQLVFTPSGKSKFTCWGTVEE